MVRKFLGALVVGMASLILGVGAVSAAFLDIGSAVYNGQTYSLIYDEARNLTWLDYSRPAQNWDNQTSWAGGVVVSVGGMQYAEWALPTLTQAQQLYAAGPFAVFTNLAAARYWTSDTEGPTPPPIGPPVDPRESGATEASEVTGQSEPSAATQPIIAALPIITADPLGDPGPEPPQAESRVFYDFASGTSGAMEETTDYLGLAVMSGRAVPLPGAVFLLGTGLIGLLALRGRRPKP
jgi:hypothetical protein